MRGLTPCSARYLYRAPAEGTYLHRRVLLVHGAGGGGALEIAHCEPHSFLDQDFFLACLICLLGCVHRARPIPAPEQTARGAATSAREPQRKVR